MSAIEALLRDNALPLDGVRDRLGTTLVATEDGGVIGTADWRACYVILENGAVSFRRVEYDVQAAAAAIRATNLPHEFAFDIESGGAPRSSKTL